MFDLSLSELVVVAVVLLLVVGPERLPKVARTAGQWIGKVQRYAGKIKQDIMQDEVVEQVHGLHAHIRNDAGAVRQSMQEVELSMEQMTLQARYKQPATTNVTELSSEQTEPKKDA